MTSEKAKMKGNEVDPKNVVKHKMKSYIISDTPTLMILLNHSTLKEIRTLKIYYVA